MSEENIAYIKGYPILIKQLQEQLAEKDALLKEAVEMVKYTLKFIDPDDEEYCINTYENKAQQFLQKLGEK